MDWKSKLSEWDRTEIEHAQMYAKLLRHHIPEGGRLRLIAKLADALEQVTGLLVSVPEPSFEASHDTRAGSVPTA